MEKIDPMVQAVGGIMVGSKDVRLPPVGGEWPIAVNVGGDALEILGKSGNLGGGSATVVGPQLICPSIQCGRGKLGKRCSCLLGTAKCPLEGSHLAKFAIISFLTSSLGDRVSEPTNRGGASKRI
jgi:hypothetical protein